jgi:hypothetical protein
MQRARDSALVVCAAAGVTAPLQALEMSRDAAAGSVQLAPGP